MIGNYTIIFESEFYDNYYMKKPKSQMFFSAVNKIKDCVNGMPIYVNSKFLKYYNNSFKEERFYADKIYQVDIKSCYASILFNSKLIDKNTFEFIMQLSKSDRLAAVGSMATCKNVFKYNDEGDIENFEEIQSVYSDYFYFCIQETYKIMNDVKCIIGNDFLFSWVDAVYFINENNGSVIQDYLKKEYKLESSFNTLTEFNVELKNGYYKATYIKGGVSHYMNIPLSGSTEKRNIISNLLTFKNK